MKESSVVLLGIEMTVKKGISSYRWLTKNEVPMKREPFPYQKSKFNDETVEPLCEGLYQIITELSQQGIVQQNDDIGLFVNVSNAIWPDIERYAHALEKGKKAVRPHMTISFENSLPTAQASIQLGLNGPSTTFADHCGKMYSIGLAHNVLVDRLADFMLVAEMYREPVTNGDDNGFTGRITIAALAAPLQSQAYQPLFEIKNWEWINEQTEQMNFSEWIQQYADSNQGQEVIRLT
ncbi:hypothetical protein [Bacillus sp. WMMC1349]|uniref:hypothetical protein n=1 Tax=Bacillus sp. WMMC1349 TaxID=2736254 RepID=UPI001C12FC1F|nr:hypothetical protein [Bacillus sp. WMMC1349]